MSAELAGELISVLRSIECNLTFIFLVLVCMLLFKRMGK